MCHVYVSHFLGCQCVFIDLIRDYARYLKHPLNTTRERGGGARLIPRVLEAGGFTRFERDAE